MGILIEAKKSKSFDVILDSNPTTGFSWAIVGNLPRGLEHISNEYVMSKPQSPMVMGRGGQEVWIFKAVEVGHFSFQMEYGSPFVETDSEKKRIDVVVK